VIHHSGDAGLVETITTTRESLGLSPAEAASRLELHGRNEIPEPRPPGVLARAADQLRDPMILLLLGAAAITVALRDVVDTVVIGLVVVLNTTVGVVQEIRAERTVRALRRLAAPTARVIRDGTHLVVPAAELVPGDLVQLDAGDIVPADARLLQAMALQVDESAMTGEAVPVDKEAPGEPGGGQPPEDGAGVVHAGTVVTKGRARAVVTSTGAHSSLGRIAALIADQPRRQTPLQQRLTELSRVLAITALALSAVVMGIGLARGESVGSMFITGVALAVAAVPESLPAVVTLSLALGAHRMARRHAIIRRLPAVETLGSVTLLASDKTGTLTEGRMVVERLWAGGGRTFTVSGSGYSPVGDIRLTDAAEPEVGAAARPDRPAIQAILRDIALCNDAEVVRPIDADGEWVPVGDPMEAALVVAAMKTGADVTELRTRYPRVAELPFDSKRRRMTTLHRYGDAWLVVSKGAPETLLPARISGHGTGEGYDAVRRTAHKLASEGYRVIAVADRVATTRPPADELERGLEVVGLVAIIDPLRSAAADVVQAFEDAGVRLLLVTGDHPATALTAGRRLGLATGTGGTGDSAKAQEPAILTGGDLDNGTSAETLERTRIFARVRPEQKLGLVQHLQSVGHVVAMTGDGVNDGPALRRADIGVAMGRGGTEVARQAADLVLQDDNLATVVAAIEEGRRIYDNIRRFLRYALSGGLAEVIVMVLGPFLGLGIPLLPAQILWVNMLTHGPPGVALGAEPADPRVLRRSPRSPRESVLGQGLAAQIGWTGCVLAVAVLAAGIWAEATGRPWQTIVFATLGLAQLGLALALRAPRQGEGGEGRFLSLAVAGALAAQLGAIYLAPLRELLGTDPLVLSDLAVVVAVSAVPAAVVCLVDRWRGSAPRIKEEGVLR
jgi:Ca2+-transporting ATPase